MQPCKYIQATKCKECDAVFYNQCKLFRRAHAEFLSRSITPFVYKPVELSSEVVWSREAQKAKSAALKYALKKNSEIKKISLNQVISLTVSNEPVEGKVFYIECVTKVAGEPEKIAGVLRSFIDKVTFEGACVSLYVSPSIVMTISDYPRI